MELLIDCRCGNSLHGKQDRIDVEFLYLSSSRVVAGTMRDLNDAECICERMEVYCLLLYASYYNGRPYLRVSGIADFDAAMQCW